MGQKPVLDYHTPEALEAGSAQREYRHITCRGKTLASGNEFINLADPFTAVTTTYCAACKNTDDLVEFEWVDTGESLREYRRRLRQAAPTSLKIWEVVRVMTLLAFTLGGLVIGGAGAFLGFGVAALIVIPVNRLLRVDFWRYR